MHNCHLLALFALFFSSVPLASAQISNGSFENFTGFTDIALCTELGPTGVDNVGSATSWNFGQDAGIAEGLTTDGNVAAWLSPGLLGVEDAVVSQTFLLTNTGSYSLCWDSFAAHPDFFPDALYRYKVDLSEVGGVSIYSNDFSEDAFDGLPTAHSVQFNATGGLHTLTFTGLGVPQLLAASAGDTFIDNVTLVVPEPVLLGDVNLDEVVDFLDIAAFIAILSSGGFQIEADIDQNREVNLADIPDFIAILVAQ